MQINWNEKSKKVVSGRQILKYLLEKQYDNYVPVGAVDCTNTDFVAVVVCIANQGGRRVFKIKREKLLGLSIKGTPKENLAWREVSLE